MHPPSHTHTSVKTPYVLGQPSIPFLEFVQQCMWQSSVLWKMHKRTKLFHHLSTGSSLFIKWWSVGWLAVWRRVLTHIKMGKCLYILKWLLCWIPLTGLFVCFLQYLQSFLHIRSYHLWTQIILFLLFICRYFKVSFSCLIALVRTSSTILNRSGESVLPCLIPSLP